MSSPYQSKLFNFLNRQSQQWRDRATAAARHLKLAAEWGVQILLSSIYLAVQAGRRTGQQLGQAATQSQLPESPSIGDKGDKGDKGNKGDKERRREVENRISSPQYQLSIFISSYISSYIEKLDRRLAEWEGKRLNPVKGLMSQFSQQLEVLVDLKIQNPDKIAVLTNIKRKFQEIQYFDFKSFSEPAGGIQNSSGMTAIASNTAEELDPFRIQVLIRAGIDYFFGQRRKDKHLPDNSTVLPPSEGESQGEDPWLFWEDLFPEQLPESAIAPELFEVESLPYPLPAGLPTPAQPGTSWRQHLRKKYQQSRQPTTLKTRPTVSNKLAEKSTQTGKVVSFSPSPTEVIPVSGGEESLETAFDWVEAKVTPGGYVKHPLEQILEWLDVVILWFEEWLEKGWQWLRQRL